MNRRSELPRGPLIYGYRRGRAAYKAGQPKSANPYKDARMSYNNSVTFSRAWMRAWEQGWDDEKRKPWYE